MPRYITEKAMRGALLEIGRDSNFADLLIVRYAFPSADALRAEIASPTSPRATSYGPGILLYSSIHAQPPDSRQANFRLSDAYRSVEPKDLAFFALCPGGEGKAARWKTGGPDYARSGIQRRLTNPVLLAEMISQYRRIPPGASSAEPITADPGPDTHAVTGPGSAWELVLVENYVSIAFEKLLSSRPINLWHLAAWVLRFVEIPADEDEAARNWIRANLLEQLRIPASALAATEKEAVEKRAWFFDESTLLDPLVCADRLSEKDVYNICSSIEPSDSALVHLKSNAQIEKLEPDLTQTPDGKPLVLPEGVLAQILGHIRAGKHIILTGPPGTGKTVLATNILEAARNNALGLDAAPRDYVTETASASWTTFDTVGGYVPTNRSPLEFRPGLFLRAFRENRWVLIDEFNRADIDRAFGPILTVLSGFSKPLDLSFEVDGAVVRILPPESTGEVAQASFVVPRDWRLIATMNTYDKNSLYKLSLALLRRFAVVSIPAPDSESCIEIVQDRIGRPLTSTERDLFLSLIEASRSVGRDLGPAILIDVAKYVDQRTNARVSNTSAVASALGAPSGTLAVEGATTGASGAGVLSSASAASFVEAVASLVVPQFDELEPRLVRAVHARLHSLPGLSPSDKAKLRAAFAEVLGLQVEPGDD